MFPPANPSRERGEPNGFGVGSKFSEFDLARK
ncbi:uncharacterized protein METZ01_LOCUS211998, partial [marine metagenome]